MCSMDIFTDGSKIIGSDGEAYAGAGVWFGKNDMRNTSICVPGRPPTNQIAELTAILWALKLSRRVWSITIKTDSDYSIKCITEWSKKWIKNGWSTSKNTPVLHSDEIKEILNIIEDRERNSYTTNFVHVSAHTGVEGNEGADELAKTGAKKSEEYAIQNTVFFTSGRLSQSCSSTFVANVNGEQVEYFCAEQWHQHQKALLFRDQTTANEIMKSNTPHECKRLGKLVKGFDAKKWTEHRLSIAVEGSTYKFSQNEDLREYLLKTGNRRIAESRANNVWGIGITEFEARAGAKWTGMNLLGKALMIVRDEKLQ